MDDDSELSADRDATTNCLVWRGPVSSDGYPVLYRAGEQVVVSRELFAEHFGSLPEWARLHRVCSSPLCVAPQHHVLQAPRRVAERLGYCSDDVCGLAALMRAKRQREWALQASWEVGRLADLRLEPIRARLWAIRLGVPSLLVLAAYASLVRASERASGRCSPSTQSA